MPRKTLFEWRDGDPPSLVAAGRVMLANVCMELRRLDWPSQGQGTGFVGIGGSEVTPQ